MTSEKIRPEQWIVLMIAFTALVVAPIWRVIHVSRCIEKVEAEYLAVGEVGSVLSLRADLMQWSLVEKYITDEGDVCFRAAE